MTGTERVAAFWAEYERALGARVRRYPHEYGGLGRRDPHEQPEDYARETIISLRKAVEYAKVLASGTVQWAPDFGRINYVPSTPCKAAARKVGVPFNRKGLNSVYDGVPAPK